MVSLLGAKISMKSTNYFKEMEMIHDLGLQLRSSLFIEWLDAMNDFVTTKMEENLLFIQHIKLRAYSKVETKVVLLEHQ